MQQFIRKRGQSQPDPTPEEIADIALQIRMGWSFDERQKAITDSNKARLLPDWKPEWDVELFPHRNGMTDETEL